MTLSLRTWLALGLALALAVPAAASAGAWLAAGNWQAGREHARRDEAVSVIAAGSLATEPDARALLRRLSGLGVEAQLKPTGSETAFPVDKAKAMADKKAAMARDQLKVDAIRGDLATPGADPMLMTAEGKARLNSDYTATEVSVPGIAGQLFLPKQSAAPRWAITIGAAALGLAAAIALAVALLSRWVLRPLARLAGDADRIAGGELPDGTGVRSPAREVAQVGEALHGMAGALGSALGASAAAERERRFLISAIAHDLRTPLFTLRGSLEAIERGIGDGDALGRAQRKADHLDRLVGELFAFARAEYAEHAPEPVDLGAIARRAVETVEPGAIRVEVSGDGRIHGDPVALQRVLTNLLDNAVRHARSRVDVTVSPGRVDVADDGPGFADADLPYVFEPLFRGDRARGGGGAGLGLAIARRLVRAHGGEVGAANAAAGGACVTVTLP
ncbi:sensor histidine kinase [Candidatus Solirubrobacter pratensis]|uniref:sensor histidine kinase n=1 Tax=Candidatus Solirubrobacter pratensis TaxID=1298857 RepID=UPI0004201D5D|nr:HAMP domain-containing sensor histidine kinase [Candidatus Solirubrobacter pratensis]